MPIYYFGCTGCDEATAHLLPAGEQKKPRNCKECGAPLERQPKPPSSQVMERLDNGAMPRAVERLSEADRLNKERVKGKRQELLGH